MKTPTQICKTGRLAAVLGTLALLLGAPSPAEAKRAAPPEIKPVTVGETVYEVPNTSGRRAILQAWDAKKTKLQWEVTVFETPIKPDLEEDVQWVFVSKLHVEGDQLAVWSESGVKFLVDMKTRQVTQEAMSEAVVVTEDKEHPKIQLAILLDTSGSMQGLINQARTQLWKIVNEFITAKQNGQTPYVEVALYEYGNDAQPAKDHWIRLIQPLTRDLDKISEELFKLTTNGGEEYCGAVIQRAVKDLEWDKNPGTYKAIFIAGNEPFNQGPIDPKNSCREAIGRGIIVNTIHCGNEAEGRNGDWHTGAVLADGKFLNIDQNQAVAAIAAPQDAELVKLNEELNKTYVWYGAKGRMDCENQKMQDANAAAAAPAAAVQRAATKASGNYYKADSDLVDRAKEKDFDLSKLKAEDLPEEMKKMSDAEKKAHLEKKTAERTDLQKKILDLNKAREAYVAEKLKEQGKDTLDTAVTKAVREQAAAKQIVWEK